MYEKPRIAKCKIPEPTSGLMHTPTKTLIPSYRPFDQSPVKYTENPHQLMYPEPPKVVNPTPDFRIKYFRNPVDTTSSPAMKF
jgi:hypothetical protein